MDQFTVFRVTKGEVWQAARDQGAELTFSQVMELYEQVGDELDRCVPEIIKDVVGDYIYEKEEL